MIYMSTPSSRQIPGMEKCRIRLDADWRMRSVRNAYRGMRKRGMATYEARLVVFDLLDAGRCGMFFSESHPEGV